MNKIFLIIILLLLSLFTFSQSGKVIGKFDELYVKSPRTGVGTEKIMVWDSLKKEVKIVSSSTASPKIPGGSITRNSSVGINPGTSLDAATWIINTFYPFIPATITLSATTYVEMGDSTEVTLIPNITENQETVFSLGSTNKTAPLPLVELTTWSGSTPTNTTLTVLPTQNDITTHSSMYRSYQSVGNNGSPGEIASNAVYIIACYPYLYGMSSLDLGSGVGFYEEMSKIIQPCTSTNSITFNSSDLKYAYFAFPATCSDLTSIKDQNGFEQITAFTKYQVYIDSYGLLNDWNTISYKIYKSNNKFLTTGNWTYTFQ